MIQFSKAGTSDALVLNCISKSAFTDALRSLNSERDRVFVAELNMGLDSITINRDDLKPLDALKSLIKM